MGGVGSPRAVVVFACFPCLFPACAGSHTDGQHFRPLLIVSGFRFSVDTSSTSDGATLLMYIVASGNGDFGHSTRDSSAVASSSSAAEARNLSGMYCFVASDC